MKFYLFYIQAIILHIVEMEYLVLKIVKYLVLLRIFLIFRGRIPGSPSYQGVIPNLRRSSSSRVFSLEPVLLTELLTIQHGSSYAWFYSDDGRGRCLAPRVTGRPLLRNLRQQLLFLRSKCLHSPWIHLFFVHNSINAWLFPSISKSSHLFLAWSIFPGLVRFTTKMNFHKATVNCNQEG